MHILTLSAYQLGHSKLRKLVLFFYHQTDRQTNRQTNRHTCAKQYTPTFFKRGA